MNNSTDESSRRPLKHEDLIGRIREAIATGEFKPGDLLPSQNEMCREFGVSHNTVREAVGALVAEGLLHRVQGKGTFVAERRKPLTFGLLMPHLDVSGDVRYERGYDIPPLLVQYIEEEARANGACVLLSLDNDSPAIERENLRNLVDRRLDGIIVYYIGEDENMDCLREAMASGAPMVFIDRRPEGLECDYVVTDNVAGAFQAVSTLLSRGFNRIYHLTYTMKLQTVSDRTLGVQRAVSAMGGSVTARSVAISTTQRLPDQERDAYLAAKETLKDAVEPFAVFAQCSPVLVGAWRAIKEMGFSHSGVALASFDEPWIDIPDDVLFLQVIQPLESIGRKSVRILMDRIGGERRPERIVLNPSMRIVGKG